LEKLVTEWSLKHSAEQVEATLQKAGVPANVVEKPSDIYQDPPARTPPLFYSPRTSGDGKTEI
jgi:crotonobetainyl-CoA:carnitine CoA-transferase CaiB-like acyl-CoA transferase